MTLFVCRSFQGCIHVQGEKIRTETFEDQEIQMGEKAGQAWLAV